MYANARNQYNNYGTSLGITYNFYEKFTLSGNLNYSNIRTSNERDVFVTVFNTPNRITNISFGNREVVKNQVFNVVWRWQDIFL